MRSLGLFTFMIPVGFTVACSILVGTNIGKGDIKAIKHYYRLSIICATIVGAIQVVILLFARDWIISIFTTEEAVIEQMEMAWSIFLVFVLFDTIQGVAQAAIRASQQQKCGAIITALAYWVIGIPVTLLLVFKYAKGIRGIWVGPTLAVTFLTITYIQIFTSMNWKDLVEKAKAQREADMKANAIIEEDDDSFKS